MLTAADTAYAMAFIRAQEMERPEGERLFEDPYARIFDAAGEHAREGTHRFLSLPFLVDAVRLRTRYIDDVTRSGCGRGVRQLVLMGAGFDVRALRLPEIARGGVRTFEVDFPAQLEAKRALLLGAGVAIPDTIRHVACDFMTGFETRLAEDLVREGFRRGDPAMFVCEGVLAYLDPEATERTCRFMASMGGEGSTLVFDFSDYVHGPEWAPDLVRRAGFTGFDEVSCAELWRRHLPGDPPLNPWPVKLGLATR